MAKDSEQFTASDVRAALRARFEGRAWACFDEVGNATGSRCSRYADFIAVSLWPSRGLEIHGVEIKVSRTDWLKELRDPKKADDIQKFCDRWWVAAGSESIVRAGELPPTWGLLELNKRKRLVAKVEAPKLEPEQLTKGFVAALLRRAAHGFDSALAAAHREGFERGKGAGPEDHQRTVAALQRELDAMKTTSSRFEAESGLKLDTWNAGNIGSVVAKLSKLHNRYRTEDPDLALERAAEALEGAARRLRDELDDERERLRIARELSPEQVEALRRTA